MPTRLTSFSKRILFGAAVFAVILAAGIATARGINLRRYVQGGAGALCEIPSGIGSRPVVADTYGLHPMIWGVGFNSADGEKAFDLAANVGAPFIRMSFFRQWLQPERGRFTWEMTDRYVRLADERGLKIVPSIVHGNSFWGSLKIADGRYAQSRGRVPVSISGIPIDLAEQWDPRFGYSRTIYEFYRELLTRYPGKFPFLTVGNEPNSDKFWAGSVEEYVRLIQTAAKAIHETDSSVRVIDGGMASEFWGFCIARHNHRSGKWNDAEAASFVRRYYRHAKRERTISKGSDADILRELLSDGAETRKMASIDTYIRGLIGHVDALNFHFYEDVEDLPVVISFVRERAQAAGWRNPVLVINELGNKEHNDPDYDVAGADQANDLRAKLEIASREGFPLIIWFSVNSEDTLTGGFLSIHARDGTPFEAAHEYRRFLLEQKR